MGVAYLDDHTWPPPSSLRLTPELRHRLTAPPGLGLALPPVALEAFLGVFGQQVADRQAALLGPGGEPLGQRARHDHHAPHAVVALPHVVGRLRHALSSRRTRARAPQTRRTGAARGRSAS